MSRISPRHARMMVVLIAAAGCGGSTAPRDAGVDLGGDTSSAGTGGASGAGTGGAGGAGTGGAGGGAVTCATMGQPCSYVHPCCAGLICAGGCSMGVSDRNLKRDLAPVDDDQILESLVRLPISTWRYTTDETAARHIGPMAQDFQSAFHVGSTDKLIYQVDGDGVAFAAIKSLNARLDRLADENARLRRELARVRAEVRAARRGSQAKAEEDR
jgi:hypothetical protein